MWLFESACVICEAPSSGVCESCVGQLVSASVPPLLGIHSATALCSYEGVGADLLQSLKYQNRRHVLGSLVDALATGIDSDIDAIVPVPGNTRRVRERGVDLPAVIARRLSRRLGVPVAQPLFRIDDGSQVGRGRAERTSIEFRAVRQVSGRVLLVDDVVTTGATAVACAAALDLAGCPAVSFASLAATPISQSAYQGSMQ